VDSLNQQIFLFPKEDFEYWLFISEGFNIDRNAKERLFLLDKFISLVQTHNPE